MKELHEIAWWRPHHDHTNCGITAYSSLGCKEHVLSTPIAPLVTVWVVLRKKKSCQVHEFQLFTSHLITKAGDAICLNDKPDHLLDAFFKNYRISKEGLCVPDAHVVCPFLQFLVPYAFCSHHAVPTSPTYNLVNFMKKQLYIWWKSEAWYAWCVPKFQHL